MKGYNALTGAKVKLGRWSEYLAMRAGILRLNADYREVLSNDLGAVGGFLFDVGTGRYPLPPGDTGGEARAAWEADLAKVRNEAKADRRAPSDAGEQTHTEVQAWLRDLGHALGFRVHIAANDRRRVWNGAHLGDGCLEELPAALASAPGCETVRLIDVLWLDAEGVATAGFEVEHSTSIYSGIMRLLDLALGGSTATRDLFVVAPDNREDEVRNQVRRPAFRHIADLQVRFLPYSELKQHRESMARFGSGLKAIQAVARVLD